METLKYLPAVSERMRGGVASIGYDRVLQIRDEVVLLESTASVVLGIDREKMMATDLATFVAACDLKRTAVAAMSSSEFDTLVDGLHEVILTAAASPDPKSAMRDVISTLVALFA